jgi:hypothetical protein
MEGDFVMKAPILLLSFLLGLTLFCSCAIIGSDVYVHQPEMCTKIEDVVLSPVSMSELDKFRLKKSIMPTQLLAEELRKQNLFTIISSDSLSKYAQDTHDTACDQAVFLNLAKEANVDAIIFSELKYFTIQGVENAEFHIKINEVSTGKIVIESRHNTFSGNTYWTMPNLEKVTRDAVEGAVKGIVQKFSKQ